ncbi:MAG: MarR family transcriptional regulator [Thermoplasmatota archaeon]
MRTKRNKGKVKDISKTEQIANVFIERPLDSISPKEISRELGMEIQLVTSIVSRLRAEGLVERVGWGRYKLRMEQTIAHDILEQVSSDYWDLTRNILAGSGKGVAEGEGDHFDRIVRIFVEVKKVGGDVMAQNLLRLAARKSMPHEDVKILVGSVKEVTRK